jgi:hypothetical protein
MSAALRRFVARSLIVAVVLVAAVLSPGVDRPAWSAMSADDWAGLWRGTYVCSQGVTGLNLTIRRVDDKNLTAVFSFFAVPENPGVPSGEFEMTGQVEASGHLLLYPTEWTRETPGYVSVGLDGAQVPGSGVYRGQVDGGGCGRFLLRRDPG